MRYFLLINLALVSFITNCYAAPREAPISYSLTDINIVRTHMPKLPWDKDDNTPITPPAAPPLAFKVELRSALTFYAQEGWFSLGGITENKGVMFVFDSPMQAPIMRSNFFAPMDILFINNEGKITQIAPSIILADLKNEKYSEAAVKALLFLKGGICTAQSITIGDYIEHEAFERAPLVLGKLD